MFLLVAGTDEAKKEAENECARIDKEIEEAEEKHKSVNEEIAQIVHSGASTSSGR